MKINEVLIEIAKGFLFPNLKTIWNKYLVSEYVLKKILYCV